MKTNNVIALSACLAALALHTNALPIDPQFKEGFKNGDFTTTNDLQNRHIGQGKDVTPSSTLQRRDRHEEARNYAVNNGIETFPSPPPFSNIPPRPYDVQRRDNYEDLRRALGVGGGSREEAEALPERRNHGDNVNGHYHYHKAGKKGKEEGKEEVGSSPEDANATQEDPPPPGAGAGAGAVEEEAPPERRDHGDHHQGHHEGFRGLPSGGMMEDAPPEHRDHGDHHQGHHHGFRGPPSGGVMEEEAPPVRRSQGDKHHQVEQGQEQGYMKRSDGMPSVDPGDSVLMKRSGITNPLRMFNSPKGPTPKKFTRTNTQKVQSFGARAGELGHKTLSTGKKYGSRLLSGAKEGIRNGRNRNRGSRPVKRDVLPSITIQGGDQMVSRDVASSLGKDDSAIFKRSQSPKKAEPFRKPRSNSSPSGQPTRASESKKIEKGKSSEVRSGNRDVEKGGKRMEAPVAKRDISSTIAGEGGDRIMSRDVTSSFSDNGDSTMVKRFAHQYMAHSSKNDAHRRDVQSSSDNGGSTMVKRMVHQHMVRPSKNVSPSSKVSPVLPRDVASSISQDDPTMVKRSAPYTKIKKMKKMKKMKKLKVL